MKRSQRWNNFQICPRRDSNTSGSDLWSNTLRLDHTGTNDYGAICIVLYAVNQEKCIINFCQFSQCSSPFMSFIRLVFHTLWEIMWQSNIMLFMQFIYTQDTFEIRMGYGPYICWFVKIIFGDKWKKLKLISFGQHIVTNFTYYWQWWRQLTIKLYCWDQEDHLTMKTDNC